MHRAKLAANEMNGEMNMKKLICALALLASGSALAGGFTCPPMTMATDQCTAKSETAKTQEIRDTFQEILICYGKGGYSIVTKDSHGHIETSAVQSQSSKKILSLLLLDDESQQWIAKISINKESESATNAKVTFLLPGNDMKLNCGKVR